MATAQVSVDKTIAQETALSKSVWYMGGLMTVHADSTETTGQFALIEAYSGPGMEPPMHVHKNEDELFYVVEGKLTVFRGSEVLEATAGTSVFLPRGTPHTFRIESKTARGLILITPGGFENYFREIGAPAQQLILPPCPVIPELDRLIQTAHKYDIEFVDAQ
jgi:quercetin dioxygenase-like cupin family protein